LSRHRKRGPGKRRASRRTGVAVPLTAVITALVAVIGAVTYLVGFRPGANSTAGAVAAVMAVPTSHAMATLEEQRRQLIAMSIASHAISLVGKPSLASRQPPPSSGGGGSGGNGPPAAPPDPGTAQSIAWDMMPQFGWSPQTYFSCLNNIWTRESGWLYDAENPISGAYGIPQALPGDKMASAGPNWETDPTTQIRWGLGYIQSVYGNPCSAWDFWQAHGYY
jgi:resuscitation-promoting factor RpfB